MQRLHRCAALILVPFAAAVLAADGPREGKWEYTSEMKIAGMPEMPQLPPGMKLPPGVSMPQMGPGGITSTFTHCVTKDDLVPRNDKGKEKCDVTKMDRKGNTVTWAMVCTTEDGKMNGEGTASYNGASMTSTMHMTGTSHGEPIDMTQNMKGKYLGACDAK